MRRILPVALLFAIITSGAYGWKRLHRAHAPRRVLLLEPTVGGGMTKAEAQSLGMFLVDALETRADMAVTTLSALPEPYQPEGELLLLRPKTSREGVTLRLSVEWAELGPGRDGAWRTFESHGQTPDTAITALLEALPLKLGPPIPAFLPRSPEHFWDLLRADSAVNTNVDLDAAISLAQQLAREEPDCATIQSTLANLDTLRILQHPRLLDGRIDMALASAERALVLLPGYPRALRFASRLLSDQGHQDEALLRLKKGLYLHPQSLNLLFALDYAARTAGLLDIALGARSSVSTLWSGTPVLPPTGFTYLYAGKVDAFEASFRASPNTTPDGFNAFNRGYAALIRNHPDEAAREFQSVEQDPATEGHFRALAKVFRFQINGKTADARQALDTLDRSRMGLQVPDGEFTFTMAEAAAFLGEEGFAMDLAQRSFSQGFVCAAWYRGSPFMAALQPLPRWRSILQHVDERQARLAAAFHPRDFGL